MTANLTAAPRASINLRLAALVAAGLGVTSLVVLALLGYPLAAAFFCAGLALGMLNTTLVQRSAARFAARGEPSKKRFAGAVLGRLALITALALGIAAWRPEGLGVFAGLAACQLLMIFMASVPLLRQLRQADLGTQPADHRSGAQP